MNMEKYGGFGESPEMVNHPKAYERAQRVVSEGRIDVGSFSDLYGEDVIKTDNAYVEARLQQFHANDFRNPDARVAKEKAEIFEAIMFQEGDQAMWFGEDSAIIMPSLYDDIHNGVDSLVEIERQAGLSIAALSLDLTFRRDVAGKIDHIADKIAKGHLARVKYYESQLGSLRGEVSDIPHFVVGADGRTLAELTNLFAEGKSSQFATHPVQFQIIESIILQADAFQALGDRYDIPKVTKAYERIGRIFREIYDSRQETVKDSGQRDQFFGHLKDGISRLGV